MALKVLRSETLSLSKVGDVTLFVEEALEQSTSFMLSCYGHPECSSLTDARQKIWSLKVSRSIGAAPKLQSLPPTNEAFTENVARAHLQVAIWKQALELNPPKRGSSDPRMDQTRRFHISDSHNRSGQCASCSR